MRCSCGSHIEVTAIDRIGGQRPPEPVDGVDRLHIEISLNTDSPFALSRDMVRAHKLPADTLLIKHPAEADYISTDSPHARSSRW